MQLQWQGKKGLGNVNKEEGPPVSLWSIAVSRTTRASTVIRTARASKG